MANLKRVYFSSLGRANGEDNSRMPGNVKNPLFNQNTMSVGQETEAAKEANYGNQDNNYGEFEYGTGVNKEKYAFCSYEKEANRLYNRMLGKQEGSTIEASTQNSVGGTGYSMRDTFMPLNINPADTVTFEADQDYLCEACIGFDPSKEGERRFVGKRVGLEDIVRVESRKSSSWRSHLPVFTNSPVASNVNSINDLNNSNKGSSAGVGFGKSQPVLMPNANLQFVPVHVQVQQYTINDIVRRRVEQLYNTYNGAQNSSGMAGCNLVKYLTEQYIFDFWKKKLGYACVGAGLKTEKNTEGDSWSVSKVVDDNEDSFEGLFNCSSMNVIGPSDPLFHEIFGDSFNGFATADFNTVQNIFRNLAVKLASNAVYGGAHPFKKVRIAVDYLTYQELRANVEVTNVVAGMNAGAARTRLAIGYEVLAQQIAITNGYEPLDFGSILIYPSKFLSEVNSVNKDVNDGYRQFSVGSYGYDANAAEGSRYKYKRKMAVYDPNCHVYPDIMSPTVVLSQRTIAEMMNGELWDNVSEADFQRLTSTDLEIAICYQYAQIVTPGVSYANGYIINFADETSPVDLDYIEFNAD